MNVLHIHDHGLRLDAGGNVSAGSPSGGIDRYLEAVIGALHRQHVHSSVVRCTTSPSVEAEKPPFYYELRSSNLRRRRSAHDRVREIISAADAHVVHLHSVYYALDPELVGLVRSLKPIVYTLHDVTPVCFRQTRLYRGESICERSVGLGCVTSGCYWPGSRLGVLRDTLEMFMNKRQLREYRELPVVIVPSTYLRDELLRHEFVPERVHVVPHFAAQTELRDSAVSAGESLILFAGRLTHEKGTLHFVDALARVPRGPWRAMIIGDGPQRTEVESAVQRNGLSSRVSMHTNMDRASLLDCMHRAKFVVMPSIQPESFGLVGLEAMSQGCPVIGYPAGGMTEWLVDNHTGLQARHGSTDDLAALMNQLLNDDDLRMRLSAEARRYVNEHFSESLHIERLTGLYGQAVTMFEAGTN